MSKLQSLYEQRLIGIRDLILKELKTEPNKLNEIEDLIFYYSTYSYFTFTYSDISISLTKIINGYKIEFEFYNYNAWSTFLFSRWLDEIEETILLIIKNNKIN